MKTTLSISPKVIASTVVTIILTGLVASLNAVTPEMFDWAGDYKPLLLVAVAAIATAVAGYLKNDPLRFADGEGVVVSDYHGEHEAVNEADDVDPVDETEDTDDEVPGAEVDKQ